MTRIRKHIAAACVLTWAALCLPSYASTGVIPSCYDSKLPAPTAPIAKELFVIIDQTIQLNDQLRQAVANETKPFLAPGNAFSILVFSAYTQGKYTQVLSFGQLSHPIPSVQRNSISKPALIKFDLCMARQPALAAQAVGGALRAAFEGSSGDIAKSDVFASLKDISNRVRSSQATERVVLLVSDMLENSSVTSFYSNQAVRKIETEREMKLAIDNQLIGDFGNARIYVIGAGLLNDEAKKNKALYRDPKTMQALANFWSAYFAKSQAQLIEFGQPALLNPIH